MKTIRKTATIAQLNGIKVSDPAYVKGMPYRYESAAKAENVQLEFIARRENGGGYPYIEFTLLIQPKAEAFIEMEDDQVTLTRPKVYKQKDYEIGIDTASVYIGTHLGSRNAELNAALDTGTDGLFGSVLEFAYKGKWAGTVLMASIDECFATADSLWEHLKVTFRAEE